MAGMTISLPHVEVGTPELTEHPVASPEERLRNLKNSRREIYRRLGTQIPDREERLALESQLSALSADIHVLEVQVA
jgi:hypothetical protein